MFEENVNANRYYRYMENIKNIPAKLIAGIILF